MCPKYPNELYTKLPFLSTISEEKRENIPKEPHPAGHDSFGSYEKGKVSDISNPESHAWDGHVLWGHWWRISHAFRAISGSRS